MARDMTAYKLQLAALIKPLHAAQYTADFLWSDILSRLPSFGEGWGGMEMNPDFQRGHVWTPEQQNHFLANCLRGIVPTSGFLIQFNCPHWNDDSVETDLPKNMQCVDGLQRLTAITEFMKGNLKPFGLHPDDLKGTEFSPTRLHIKVAVHNFTTRADLLAFYLAVNSGGTQHSPEELERVRGLLAQAKQGDV